MVLHLFSLEKGDYASNAFNAFNFSLFGVVKLASGKPMLPNAVETYVFPPVTALITSFEGVHRNAAAGPWAKMWLTLLVPDLVETQIYRAISSTVRDAFLSFFTLTNYQGEFDTSADPDLRPLNRKHIEGVVAIPGIIMGLTGAQMSTALYPRQDYGLSKEGLILKTIFFHNLLTNTLFSFGNRLLGCLLAMAVGRNFDFKAWGEGSWRLAVSFGTWFISQYMSKEGDTDDGKYNPLGDAFHEYPAHDSSPYTLPYAKDTYYYCIQGNQGWFSHHSQNVQQTYSYDFSMDQGDIILAARPGTVVDYFDWVADDANPGWEDLTAPNEATASGFLVPNQTGHDTWNFICIRHDSDQDGAAAEPDDVHDRGAGHALITTYAVYGHGRKDSVRELFGARGVAPQSIIGTQVKRGDRIMRAGNTGVSFNNHLHIMVHAGPEAPDLPADRLLPVKRSNLADGTIPFVFKDVTHIIGRDGVCKSLNWYTSTTVDLQAPATP
jgi:murein DD-endopeptidase MepM/ murein hydrolase activator NlpD